MDVNMNISVLMHLILKDYQYVLEQCLRERAVTIQEELVLHMMNFDAKSYVSRSQLRECRILNG